MNIKNILLISLLISFSLCAKRIYNLTENEFIEVSKETKNTKIKWLMIFYTKDFDEYYKFMSLLKEDVYKKYRKNKNIKFGLLEINVKNYKWFTFMFDIKSIPFLILVSDERMYYYKDEEVSEENIVKFIDDNKTLNDSYPVPKKLNKFIKGIIIFKFFIEDLNNFFEIFSEKSNFKFKWNIKFTYAIVAFVLILFFIFEFYIIKMCMKCKSNDKENKIEINNENKENKKNGKDKND